MKFLSSLLRLLWMSVLSVMLATGILTLLPVAKAGHGMSVTNLNIAQAFVWIFMTMFILIIIDALFTHDDKQQA